MNTRDLSFIIFSMRITFVWKLPTSSTDDVMGANEAQQGQWVWGSVILRFRLMLKVSVY